jgi:hypothetical protein
MAHILNKNVVQIINSNIRFTSNIRIKQFIVCVERKIEFVVRRRIIEINSTYNKHDCFVLNLSLYQFINDGDEELKVKQTAVRKRLLSCV